MNKTLTLVALAALTSVGLVGCSTGSPDNSDTEQVQAQSQLLAEQGLAGMGVREIIDYLDRLPVAQRPNDLIASVQHGQLVLNNQSEEIRLDLPENLSYISVAPYATRTHECFYHSLTTCLGELGTEPVEVLIIDETGEVLVDEVAETFDNGFIGYWLPEDTAGTIEITHGGAVGSTAFSTAEDGATCVTDLRVV